MTVWKLWKRTRLIIFYCPCTHYLVLATYCHAMNPRSSLKSEQLIKQNGKYRLNHERGQSGRIPSLEILRTYLKFLKDQNGIFHFPLDSSPSVFRDSATAKRTRARPITRTWQWWLSQTAQDAFCSFCNRSGHTLPAAFWRRYFLIKYIRGTGDGR